jgi:hypothetical protein
MRPPGLADKRFESLYLFAACCPGTDQAFALALPEATLATMNLFLAAPSPGSSSLARTPSSSWIRPGGTACQRALKSPQFGACNNPHRRVRDQPSA